MAAAAYIVGQLTIERDQAQRLRLFDRLASLDMLWALTDRQSEEYEDLRRGAAGVE